MFARQNQVETRVQLPHIKPFFLTLLDTEDEGTV